MIPVAIGMQMLGAPAFATFFAAAIAIVPLAALIGKATQAVAHRVGPALGGILNATLGNAAELTIAIVLLSSGQIAVVKASLTGSIIGNLLLVLGLSLFAGGSRFKSPTFNSTGASSSAAMLVLAVIGLLMPAVFHSVEREASMHVLTGMSIGISIILILSYAAGLIFSLKTHRHLFESDEAETQAEEERVSWKLGTAIGVLAAAMLGVVAMAELVSRTVETAASALHLSHTFVGIIIIAIVGNAAENSTAVLVALRGKMDLAIGIAVESSKQIALFVAPLLVLLSLFIAPEPMTLEFTMMEVVACIAATGIVTVVVMDGKTNWLEGVQLVAVYAVMGVVFFYMP